MKKNKYNGSTLVEALIAVSIFSLVVLVFSAALANIFMSRVKNRNRIVASLIGQQAMEMTYNYAANVNQWHQFTNMVIEWTSEPEEERVYHPEFQNSKIGLLKGESIQNSKFHTYVKLDYATRDIDGNLSETGVADENTIKTKTVVYWYEGEKLEQIEFTNYLIDLN